LLIVSAPSGAGKTTLVERLVESTPGLKMSRSYTSRAARQGEADGVDYNFVSRSRFEEMAAAGEFLEWAEVFGNLYGTSAADTRRLLDDGVTVLGIDNLNPYYDPALKRARLARIEGRNGFSFAEADIADGDEGLLLLGPERMPRCP